VIIGDQSVNLQILDVLSLTETRSRMRKCGSRVTHPRITRNRLNFQNGIVVVAPADRQTSDSERIRVAPSSIHHYPRGRETGQGSGAVPRSSPPIEENRYPNRGRDDTSGFKGGLPSPSWSLAGTADRKLLCASIDSELLAQVCLSPYQFNNSSTNLHFPH